jgi:hypothetical protein
MEMRTFVCIPSIDQFTSPAAKLIPLIPAAIVNIAPERASEFEKYFPEFTVHITDSSSWRFRVRLEDKIIEVSVFCLETLWATAYAHTLLYQRLVSGRMPDNEFAIQALTTSECTLADKLLKWITDRRIGRIKDSQWPTELPSPSQPFKYGDSLHLANEIALGAFGFIIHHELAHIHLLHYGENIDSERDADHSAVDWLLSDGRLDVDSLEGKKRLLCIAHALSVTVIKGIYDGDFDGETHPRSFDRLEYALSRHLRDNNHQCRAFIAFVLHWHVSRSSIRFRMKEQMPKDFDDIVQAFFDSLAEFAETPVRVP